MSTTNTKIDLSNRLFYTIIALIIVVGLFLISNAFDTWKNVTGYYPREISVDATGKAMVVPDLATVSVGFEAKAEKADAAVEENTRVMNEVNVALKELGLSEKDIQTAYYHLGENYVYEDGKSSQEGYSLTHNIDVKVRDFDQLGKVIETATALGVNMVGGVSFKVEDMDEAKGLARAEAISKAKAKARQIADESGLRLGGLLNYYENNYGDYGKGNFAMMEMDEAAFDGGGALEKVAPAFEPGEQEITLNVTLNYRVY
jgi:uncharacterized protein